VMINERVCEGCGDCGAKSNCLSVQPIETVFGRKTHIDQTSCNLDYSCITGDCPSFVTITPGKGHRHIKPRKPAKPARSLTPAQSPTPISVVPTEQCTLRLPGIGGTGVVTVSQIIGTAAMLDGFEVRGLDQTGLSQKAGPVVSDVVLSRQHISGSNKAASGEVDAMIAFDLLGAASDAQIKGASSQRTVVIASSSATTTGSMVLNPGLPYPQQQDLQARLDGCSRASLNRYVPATELVTGLFGDATTANIFVVGVAYQAGALPIAAQCLERAIELNGVAVERNLAAFGWGRQWIVDADAVNAAAGLRGSVVATEDPLTMRANDLVAYQSKAYSQRYLDVVEQVRSAGASNELVETVGKNLYKLMAYKDEYEVARLLLAPEAKAAAEAIGGPGARVQWNLHPPMLRALGMKDKLKLGRWATPLLMGLRAARKVRGTPFDVAGWSKLRRTERTLVAEYSANITRMLRDGADHQRIQQVAALPEMIRGYESIKEANITAYRSRLAELLEK
jgi:indolepyruvate ferredoxin oxidoreductase